MAILANIKYGFPSRRLRVIGVTGTDGKTTTVNMIYQILKDSGKKVSMISTINAVIGEKLYNTGFHVTSPNSMMVQNFLSNAVKNGVEVMVLEVTSHALDQYRFWGVKFDIGVITNITHEHLDYHKTWENYFLAKARLIKNVSTAILNKDEKHFERLKKFTDGYVISFGLRKTADFNPLKFPLRPKIPGEFNILNALAASAVTNNMGVKSDIIKKTLSEFENLSGRMEVVKNDKGYKIYIDFAHTPNGLEQVLKTLRSQLKGGRLISLIGAEGERDEQKRPMLGEVATKLSDLVVITAVDPRGLLDRINNQIISGAKKVGAVRDKNMFVIDDRQKAIDFTLNKLAKKGDIVGIFGKGHEKSMNLDGKKEIPWSDVKAVKRALNG